MKCKTCGAELEPAGHPMLVAMILEYMFILPSQIAFLNWQVYTHNNPIRRDLEEIKKELNSLKKIMR